MARISYTEKHKDLASTETVFHEQGEVVWRTEEGKFHRIGAPAHEFDNGDKVWYVNGLRHNEEGPAIQLANGENHYYIEGKELSLDQFQQWKLDGIKAQAADFTQSVVNAVMAPHDDDLHAPARARFTRRNTPEI